MYMKKITLHNPLYIHNPQSSSLFQLDLNKGGNIVHNTQISSWFHPMVYSQPSHD